VNRSCRRRALVIGALLGACAVLSGCARPPAPVRLTHGERSYLPGDYGTVLERWTRGGNLMGVPDFEQRLRVDATYLAWDFRWARTVRFASEARMSAEEMRTVLRQSLEAGQREHEFFVALETQSVRWGELTRPSSAWRVRLVDDRGREFAPVRIERVRQLGASESQDYPYITPWRQLFRVYFPRESVVGEAPVAVLGPGTRAFVLRFSGALGTVDLRWDVEAEGTP
jgi:hypothetical protein